MRHTQGQLAGCGHTGLTPIPLLRGHLGNLPGAHTASVSPSIPVPKWLQAAAWSVWAQLPLLPGVRPGPLPWAMGQGDLQISRAIHPVRPVPGALSTPSGWTAGPQSLVWTLS